jgi:hypothetical protein
MNENQAPQKTPVTNSKRHKASNWISFTIFALTVNRLGIYLSFNRQNERDHGDWLNYF